MTLADWASIATIAASLIASLALIATYHSLTLVRQQLSENIQSNRDITAHHLTSLNTELNLKLIEEPLATLWARGVSEWKTLTAVDQIRYEKLLALWFSTYQNAFFHKNSVIGDKAYESIYDSAMRHFLLQNGAVPRWNAISQHFDESFRRHVNTLIGPIGPNTSSSA